MLKCDTVIAGSDYILNHIYTNYKTDKKFLSSKEELILTISQSKMFLMLKNKNLEIT